MQAANKILSLGKSENLFNEKKKIIIHTLCAFVAEPARFKSAKISVRVINTKCGEIMKNK